MITNFVVGTGSIEQLEFSRAGDRLLCLGTRADNKRRVVRLVERVVLDVLRRNRENYAL